MIIVKTDSNYVFGGFASKALAVNVGSTDPNAYLFLLRSNGNSANQKFEQPGSADGYKLGSLYAIRIGNIAIEISFNSDANLGSTSKLCSSSFVCPQGVTSWAYLTGTDSGWKTPEIEVYQMS